MRDDAIVVEKVGDTELDYCSQIQIIKTMFGYGVQVDSLSVGDFLLLPEAWVFVRRLVTERLTLNQILFRQDTEAAKISVH